MFALLTTIHLWVKAFHIIAMVAWMAGLFYLPRLFVYHAERARPGSELDATFQIMERRLLQAIMTPAMIATWVFGLLLLATPGVVNFGADLWIYPKLAAVIALSGFHEWLAARQRDFAAGRNRYGGRVYRIANEAPTLALLVIVIMVIVRPF
jgi:putative membrane protein